MSANEKCLCQFMKTSICFGKREVFVLINEKVFVQKIFAWFVGRSDPEADICVG